MNSRVIRTSLLCLLSPFVIVGCNSTPYVENDTKRLTTPEIHAEPFNVSLAVAASGSNEIYPKVGEENISDGELSLEARMTTGGGAEVFVSSGDIEGAGIVYQFLGDNLETSLPGNFSAAVSAGYYRYLSDKDNSEEHTGYKVEQHMMDVSLIAGYRLHEKGLLFTSVFYRGGDIDVTVIPELGDSASFGSVPEFDHTGGVSFTLYPRTFTCEELSDSCIDNQFQSHGKLSGINLGYRHDFYNWLSLTGEVVYYRENVFGKRNSDQAFNLKVGFHF